MRQTFGDRDLARELLGLFAQQCRRLRPALAASLPAPERREAAHSLKGAARAIGAEHVAALTDSLEAALEAGEPAETFSRGLDAAIEEVLHAVADRLGGSD